MSTTIEQPAQQPRRKGPLSAEEWDLGLTILESLVILNGMQGECMSRECIADVMGISAQAIENLEIRAFKKIRLKTSHLRPELEDLGVVHRLPVGGLGKAKPRSKLSRSTLPRAERALELTKAEATPPISPEASEFCPPLAVVIASATDTIIA